MIRHRGIDQYVEKKSLSHLKIQLTKTQCLDLE